MKGSEIIALIEQDSFLRTHFDGVRAADTLGPIRSDQHFVIVNVANSEERGTHWFYIDRSGPKLTVIDPIGWHAQNTSILQNKSFLQNINEIVLTTTRYQAKESELCGQFCVYIAFHRLYLIDDPLNSVLSKIFSARDLAENERRVKRFVAKLLGARGVGHGNMSSS